MVDIRVEKLTWSKTENITSPSNTATIEINNSILYGSESETAFGRKPYLISKEYVPIGQPYDYLAMMDTKFELGVNNSWVTQRKPYLSKDYSLMLTQAGLPQSYLPTMVYLAENSPDAFGVFISNIESLEGKTRVTLRAYQGAKGTYKLFAEDTVGNKIEYLVFESGGKIFTVKKDGARYELVKYPKGFSGGSDITGRQYQWNVVEVGNTEWDEGTKHYQKITQKIQYTADLGENWVDYGDEVEQVMMTEGGADPYLTLTGNAYYGGSPLTDEENQESRTIKISYDWELFTTTPELDHADYDGITVYYGNLDVGVFSEASSAVYRSSPAGTTETDIEEEYYYYNPSNQCFLSVSRDNSVPPVTCKYHGTESGVDFEQEIIVNNNYVRYFYYSNRG